MHKDIEIIKKTVEAKRDKLNIFIKEPFGKGKYTLNYRYYKLCFLLEEGTNKLVYRTEKNQNVPITTKMFPEYLAINRPASQQVTYKMRHAGILLKLCLFGKDVYYFNPKYAFNGTQIPYFLCKLFEWDGDLLFDKHQFKIKDSFKYGGRIEKDSSSQPE